jgi:hypothetical protein
MIQASYPNQTRSLTSSFAVPTQEQHDLNPLYWDFYKKEQATVTNDCPSASNVADWNTYHNMVIASVPPAPPYDAAATGSNQCIFDASNWEWEQNPDSGHNKVID